MAPTMAARIIYLEPLAPAKPALGAPCNGCGLCCLAEPCPVGMLLSRRRTGACTALRWREKEGRYVCGLLAEPGEVLGWCSLRLQRLVQRLARRWIAAGVGCDADLVAEPQPASATDRSGT